MSRRRRPLRHASRIVAAPVSGVFATWSEGAWEFTRHWHDHYCFGLLDEGAQSWTGRRGRVEAGAGAVINTNPGEVHDGKPIGGASRRWRMLSVDSATLIAAADARADGEIGAPVIHDRELAMAIHRLFVSIERCRGTDPGPWQLGFEQDLTVASTLLLSRYGSSRTPRVAGRGSVRILRELLADDPLHPPSLAAMANMVSLSRFQVVRYFSRDVGLTPGAWLRSQRAARARALIRSGASLSSAAFAAGFADQSHMTRVFRRLYGYTPGVWQRAVVGPA